MTVRVTTLKGLEAGRYYMERLPGYYLNGEESPGRWWGRAASDLGLSGQVDPQAFLAVMAGRDPVTGENLGRRYGEGLVRGYDATFSAPKSVSVLFALGNEQIREQVVEAHDSSVDAVLGWVEDHAHTRLRQHGHVVHVDAEGIVVGMFRQHTSRRFDPQPMRWSPTGFVGRMVDGLRWTPAPSSATSGPCLRSTTPLTVLS